MIDSSALTTALQKVVLDLEDDLRARVEGDAELRGRWVIEHSMAVQRRRTAAAWVAWRDDRVTQAAVAWVLTTVFVRFCEDNGLVRPVWIAGPEHRRQEALDAQLAFFRAHPLDTDREWLLQAVKHFASLRATAELVGEHAALHLVAPSGDAVTKLLGFWRQKSDTGQLVYDFTDSSLDTRFLGDLYQDLSAYAKATFALLQTPEFVEEFILDRTLEPALDERPLDGFRMIDPTCGSGHFLLGAFDRLLDRWHKYAPAMEKQALVQQALDAVHGVDLNAFAVAIARFRLTVAALKACGLRSLEQAPAFQFHLAVGDSLLHGQHQLVLALGVEHDKAAAVSGFAYTTEDVAILRELLQPGRYDCVVGNPPYIPVADAALNEAYRERYQDVCKGGYALTAPFMARFFELATDFSPAGRVGQITSNSFMKRRFGVPVIQHLSNLHLELLVDSEGAWIPGHNMDGTPTVILVGRNQPPKTNVVRAILGKGRREGRPAGLDGSGPYWSAITQHVDDVGFDNEWISVVELDRSSLGSHPWSLQGGGALEIRRRLERARTGRPLTPTAWGFSVVTREDSAYAVGADVLRRVGVPETQSRGLGEGPALRDWVLHEIEQALWPYSEVDRLARPLQLGERRLLWPLRTLLSVRTAYGHTQLERGLTWYEYSMYFREKDTAFPRIVFSKIASHGHAVIDTVGHLYKDSCYVLAPAYSDPSLHGVAAVLNSSLTTFLLRDRSQPKGGAADDAWSRTYEYSAATLQRLEAPPHLPNETGRAFGKLVTACEGSNPSAICRFGVPKAARLIAAEQVHTNCRAVMVSLQEELDWEVYRLYGIIVDDLSYGGPDLPHLALGERAFEIALARRVAAGEEDTAWFTRHGATPITEIPAHWPAAYRELVQRRLDLIAGDPAIRLLEKPEHKRRWASEPWEKRQERALRGWLLDRLEDRRFWFDTQGRPSPKSVAQLADEVARDADLVSVLALWEGRRDVPVTSSLVRLLEPEAVPFLAAYRYKDSGLRKREAWEQTWALQRREDAGERVGTIPVPPKYAAADFRKASYWQARGKLDVPKERFVLYPNAGRDTDPTPLIGWAGWDHAQQSLALSLVIGLREAEGWADERLVPLVAGLAELQPWVEQWHSEVDPIYGVSLAAFTREQLTQRMTQVGKSLEELVAWRPAASSRGRRSTT